MSTSYQLYLFPEEHQVIYCNHIPDSLTRNEKIKEDANKIKYSLCNTQ